MPYIVSTVFVFRPHRAFRIDRRVCVFRTRLSNAFWCVILWKLPPSGTSARPLFMKSMLFQSSTSRCSTVSPVPFTPVLSVSVLAKVAACVLRRPASILTRYWRLQLHTPRMRMAHVRTVCVCSLFICIIMQPVTDIAYFRL